MKKLIIPICCLILGVGTSNATMAQEAGKKTEITKSVEVSDENGVKTVTITTDKNGQKTTEILRGEDADMFIKNHDNTFSNKGDKVEKNVEVKVENGEKTVTITTNTNGMEEVEVLTGDDANAFVHKHKRPSKLKGHRPHGHHNQNKKVEIEDINGVKTVSITTNNDGKEEVKVLTGEDANRFIERHKNGKRHHPHGKKGHTMSIDFDVKDVNGTKEVTINKERDGKKISKTLIGQEAEDFIAKHHQKRIMHDVLRAIHHSNPEELDIDITEENGEKQVRIAYVVDGKEEVEELTGEMAEMFILHHEMRDRDGDKTMVKVYEYDNNGEKESKTIIHQKGIKVIVVDKTAKVFAKGNSWDEEKVKELIKKNTGISADDLNIFLVEDWDKTCAEASKSTCKKGMKKCCKGEKEGKMRIEDAEDYLGINHANKKLDLQDLQFYPNPNDGKFEIQFTNTSNKKVEITVNDLTGKTLYIKEIKDKDMVREQIDISNQNSGVYLLHIKQGNKMVSKKILVK